MKNKEIKDMFNKRNLTILDDLTQETTRKTKLNCIDNNGYKYYLTYNGIKDDRTTNFDIVGIRNPYTIENIQTYININGGKSKVLSKEYKDIRTKLKFRCECGNEYNIIWHHLKSNKKFICNDCSTKIRTDKNLKPITYTLDICKKYGYEFVEMNTLRNVIYKDDLGYKFKSTIYSLKNRTYGVGRFSIDNPFTVYNMINHLKLNNYDLKIVDETERKINCKYDYIEWYCIECGDIFKATWQQVSQPTKHSNLRHRCKRCSKVESNLEYIVRKYLEDKNIEYISQKRYEDCRDINLLPFDFYLPKYNVCLEINGQQHYYENKVFQQTLEDRKRVDKIKEDYCFNNNIGYIAIPFWKIYNSNEEKETYKEIINNILGQK